VIPTHRRRFWGWPDGVVWRSTLGVHKSARSIRHSLFLETLAPSANETILDVGVTDSPVAWANHLEAHYPHPDRITALAVEELLEFRRAFPQVRTVIGDGCELPFADGSFDIVYSNAVIEHVGDRERQRVFLSEANRVAARAVFVTTPSRWFPMESHTMIPLVHWAPRSLAAAVWRRAGNTYYADPANLNLVSARQLRRLAQAAGLTSFNVRRQRLCGWTSNLILIAMKDRSSDPSD
jgi:hypothetical protein